MVAPFPELKCPTPKGVVVSLNSMEVVQLQQG